MECKLSFKRHIWIILGELFLLLGTLLIVPIYYFFNGINETELESMLVITSTVASIFFVPLLILHLNYYYVSKNKVFFFDFDSGRIELTENEIIRQFKFEDIKIVLIVRPYRNRLPWADYGYIKIGFKNNDPIVLTSLMENFNKLHFENTNTIKEFYPYCN